MNALPNQAVVSATTKSPCRVQVLSTKKIGANSTREAEVQVLRSIEELNYIREYWEAWPGNRDSDIDFYLTVLHSNRAFIRPHVIVIYRDGQPDAILAGRIDQRRIDFRIGYIHVSPKPRLLYFVYGALRGNDSIENSELFAQEIRKALAEGEADLAYLNFLKRDSPLFLEARRASGILSRDHICAVQSHFVRTLPGNVDEFYKQFSTKFRKNQKWQARKFASDFGGVVNILCFKDESQIRELATIANQIAGKSYQRGLGVGFVDNQESRERLLLKARKGWLRGYVLYAGEAPCAFWIGDINEGVFGSDYLSFDPTFAKYSPGMVLMMKVLEGFCSGVEPGVTGVDFATGRAQYKEILSNHEWEEVSFYIFSKSFKGVYLNSLRTVFGITDKVLKGALEKTGLLQKIKKAWRSRLQPKQQ